MVSTRQLGESGESMESAFVHEHTQGRGVGSVGSVGLVSARQVDKKSTKKVDSLFWFWFQFLHGGFGRSRASGQLMLRLSSLCQESHLPPPPRRRLPPRRSTGAAAEQALLSPPRGSTILVCLV